MKTFFFSISIVSNDDISEQKIPNAEGKATQKRIFNEVDATTVAKRTRSNETVSKDVQHARTTKTKAKSLQIARLSFAVGEIVWCKLRGHSHWPTSIKRVEANNKYEVTWFNDNNRTSIVNVSQLFRFESNFTQFGEKMKNGSNLEMAVRHALIYLSLRK